MPTTSTPPTFNSGTIDTRVLPAILQLMHELQDEAPVVDKLNRAEKQGLIPTTLKWQELSEIRNQTAHKYHAQPRLAFANLRYLMS